MTTVMLNHIRLDEKGVAWIDDSNVKVIEVALEQLAQGESADRIHEAHDGYLSLAQIHAALAFYHDNKAAFDAQIERNVEEFDRLREASLDSPGREKLRRQGLHP